MNDLPRPLGSFLADLVETLSQHEWLLGIFCTGSLATGKTDEFSDLDLLLIVEDEAHQGVMADRAAIAASLGPLLTSFTGEHLGVPRLLQCLYGPPLVHVDFLFDTLGEASKRPQASTPLWKRDDLLALPHVLESSHDIQWQAIEDRFWIWVHKAACSIGRGDLLDAVEYLGFIRNRVLAPMAWNSIGQRPLGVKGISSAAPQYAEQLKATVARCVADDCVRALRATVDLYCELRAEGTGSGAEAAVRAYLDEIADRNALK